MEKYIDESYDYINVINTSIVTKIFLMVNRRNVPLKTQTVRVIISLEIRN